jgi:hypothetical protein
MGAITMRLRSSSEPSRYGVNNALIASPRSIVKPIGAAEIARPFGDWRTSADDQGLNPSDFHQTAVDVLVSGSAHPTQLLDSGAGDRPNEASVTRNGFASSSLR